MAESITQKEPRSWLSGMSKKWQEDRYWVGTGAGFHHYARMGGWEAWLYVRRFLAGRCSWATPVKKKCRCVLGDERTYKISAVAATDAVTRWNDRLRPNIWFYKERVWGLMRSLMKCELGIISVWHQCKILINNRMRMDENWALAYQYVQKTASVS
jgi:hypothetical protein